MLSREELWSLIQAFGDACQFIKELKERCPEAEHVQYPKTPPILTHSLAALAILDGRLLSAEGPFTNVVLGGRQANILATSADGSVLEIETKGSGENDFATFGKRDYAADFLLWLRFGSELREKRLDQVEVLICPRPEEHLPSGITRVTVGQLENNWQDGPIDRTNLNLAELLRSAPN